MLCFLAAVRRPVCLSAHTAATMIVAAGLGLHLFPAAGWPAEPLQFNRDIRPILSENCFRCHGPDAHHREADLRLDQRESAVDHGAIVPGRPRDSGIVERIFSDDPDLIMPPSDGNKHLTDAQRNRLRQWIAEGAEYQSHWSYLPPRRPPALPGTNGIDTLVRRDLQAAGLELSAAADRRTLLRRLYFDLIGLPPSPEEVASFQHDMDPKAYEKRVDSLLASPHYGERMASGWLDVVRFADTIGYHSDNPRNVWPYRDYVIAAFNENKPFDRFTVEQLAGDLLPESTATQKVASCYNRLLLTTEEGGAQPKDYRARMLADRVRAIGTVWLGQTLGCCQCHDHKYDPFTMRDFYSLGAFFADIREPDIGHREQGMALPDPRQAAEMARLDEEIDECKQALEAAGVKPDAAHPPQPPRAAEFFARLKAASKARQQLVARVPHCLVSVGMPKPHTVRILPRGNWMDESGDVVLPAIPVSLAAASGGYRRGADGSQSAETAEPGRRLTRLDLANWIVSRKNPLTARVFVNRLWARFFGRGICETPDDLGSQGDWPAHPELLDWLACEFMDHGWDIKYLVRTVVTSATYRQRSTTTPEQLARDPQNRLLARQSRYRLDAELVRDNALHVAGLLEPAVGGPSVKPYQPEGYWDNLNFPRRKYQASTGKDQYRRGLYTWWQRSFPHPSLLAFDAPTREECCARRARSNTPQQALVLLNDPTYVEAARALAQRVLREGGEEFSTRLDWAWRQVLGRRPRPDEAEVAGQLLKQHRADYEREPKASAALLHVGASRVPVDLSPAELAAWTSVARVLLNLHETITRS